MNFQGKVPAEAVETAREIASRTQWPKYIVYDVLMSLAIEYRSASLPDLGVAQVSDSHKSTLPIFKSRDADDFRIKCGRISKNSDMFRHALQRGAYIVSGFMSNELPSDMTQREVFISIEKIVGKNQKLTEGLAKLADFIA